MISEGNSTQLLEDLGYTVKYKFYRSTKSNKGYTLKKTSDKKTYTNSKGTKGKKYYYKAKVAVYDPDGNLVGNTKLTDCKYAARTFRKNKC